MMLLLTHSRTACSVLKRKQKMTGLRRYYIPDRPFHNIRADKSVDRRTLSSSKTQHDGF